MEGTVFDRFVNLDAIADGFFRDAVVDHVLVYCEVFDERLVSVYVWGSVSRSEAVSELNSFKGVTNVERRRQTLLR